MRKWIFSALVVLLCSCFSSVAESNSTWPRAGLRQICEGFLPENNLNIPEAKAEMMASGISRAKFDEILDRIQAQYDSEFPRYGAHLTIERRWSDGTVNAYAYKDENDESNWVIAMYGGMARYNGMNYDGFASVACHEVGHHVGGAPLFNGDIMSVEGQSDYYATTKCLKRLFEKDDNEKILDGMSVDSTAVSKCKAEHAGKQDQLLCMRVAMSGVTLAKVLARLEGTRVPRLSTPDRTVVKKIVESHPHAQCRVDTYFQGALCRQSPYAQVSATDPAIGYCYDKGTYTRGLRPLCWFVP